MELSAQRGAVLVELDRPRILFYDMATWGLLVSKFGMFPNEQLYEQQQAEGGKRMIVLKSMETLAWFLYAGLQRDAERHGESVTIEQVQEFIRPWTYALIFNAVLQAIWGTTNTPDMPGKKAADAPGAEPAVAANAPRKASTSPKRSASRSASSAGRPTGSGPRRSRS